MKGRTLVEQIKNGTTITYSYDSSNMRTSKTVGGVKHNYYYVEGKLMYEDCPSYKLYYSYDANGFLSSIKRVKSNGVTETFGVHCNIFGDVIAIYEQGILIAKYTYDSWGKLISVTESNGLDVTGDNDIWTQNSIRYRGYVYDEETQLYYLQSRYYDPNTCRFINADGYVATDSGITGYNMFTYCGNNPINRVDSTGMFWMEVGDFFSNAWNGFKTLVKDTFGAGTSTTATISKIETAIIPYPSPITVKTGNKTSQTVAKHGDSSKPISVYANKDAQHPIKSSSAGIKFNIFDFTLNLSVGFDNIGISGSLANGNTTNSFGVKLNLAEFKVGFEFATAIKWDDTTETTYTNSSISGWTILAAYGFSSSGQPVQSPQYAYSY